MDIPFIIPQEVVKLTEVRRVPGVEPAILEIIGQDFSNVIEVYINERASPRFEIVSKNRLFAQVPDGVRITTLEVIRVMSSRLVLSREAYINFAIPLAPNYASGLTQLVQTYLKLLLQTPGSDIFDPNAGGGVLSLLRKSFDSDAVKSVISDFQVAMDKTTAQLIAKQNRQNNLALDERLLSAVIQNYSVDGRIGQVYISMSIQAQSQRTAAPLLVVLRHGPRRPTSSTSGATSAVRRTD